MLEIHAFAADLPIAVAGGVGLAAATELFGREGVRFGNRPCLIGAFLRVRGG